MVTEEVCQEEVAEVIDTDLCLQALLGGSERRNLERAISQRYVRRPIQVVVIVCAYLPSLQRSKSGCRGGDGSPSAQLRRHGSR